MINYYTYHKNSSFIEGQVINQLNLITNIQITNLLKIVNELNIPFIDIKKYVFEKEQNQMKFFA